MTAHKYKHWILTFSGEPFDPLAPDAKHFRFIDIAHALSNQCRFSGHTKEFYSVAQHSVHVSQILETWGAAPVLQLMALLHDASEAYLVDMPTPIKMQMPAYKAAEKPLQDLIEKSFLPELSPEERHAGERLTKEADLIMLATEARDLMNDPKDWPSLQGVVPCTGTITPLLPGDAKMEFILRYEYLLDRMGVSR